MLGNSAPVVGNATRKLKLRILVGQQFAGHRPSRALTRENTPSGRLQAARRPREFRADADADLRSGRTSCPQVALAFGAGVARRPRNSMRRMPISTSTAIAITWAGVGAESATRTTSPTPRTNTRKTVWLAAIHTPNAEGSPAEVPLPRTSLSTPSRRLVADRAGPVTHAADRDDDAEGEGGSEHDPQRAEELIVDGARCGCVHRVWQRAEIEVTPAGEHEQQQRHA